MDITRIYLVTNCFGDPNKIYIGKTNNSRKNDHKKTYGKDITYDYIDQVESLYSKDWKPLECFWIEYFRQLGFDLQNKNKGGGGNDFLSLETRNKIKKPILQYSLFGEFIKEWESSNDIFNFLKVSNTNITKSCKNENHQVSGFLWRYKTNNYLLKINPYIKKPKSQESRDATSRALKGISKPEGFGDMMRKVRIGVSKPKGTGDKISKALKGGIAIWRHKSVDQYDLEGNFIENYSNVNLAGIESGCNPSTISKVCRGIFKQTGGYKWEYKII